MTDIQTKILKAIKKNVPITRIASELKVNRSTVYYHINHNPVIKQAYKVYEDVIKNIFES